MKFKIFSMLVIMGMLSLMPMIYMGKFDPLSFFSSGFKGGVSDLKQIKAKVPKNLTNAITDEKVEVYKWRDEHGVMQFSNMPPPAGDNAEKLELNPNENIVQAVKIPVKEEPEEKTEAEAPSPYTMKGMKKVMKDAKDVEKMLQQRHEEQDKLLNNL